MFQQATGKQDVLPNATGRFFKHSRQLAIFARLAHQGKLARVPPSPSKVCPRSGETGRPPSQRQELSCESNSRQQNSAFNISNKHQLLHEAIVLGDFVTAFTVLSIQPSSSSSFPNHSRAASTAGEGASRTRHCVLTIFKFLHELFVDYRHPAFICTS